MPLRLFIDKLYINTTSLSRKSETLHPTARTNNLALFLFFQRKSTTLYTKRKAKNVEENVYFLEKACSSNAFLLKNTNPTFYFFCRYFSALPSFTVR